MYFLMICRHGSDVAARREEVRPLHRAYVASGGEGRARVLTGSALTDVEAAASIGNFGIIEAASPAAAHDFASNDPYALAGIVQSIELVRLADTFQAQRIEPLSH